MGEAKRRGLTTVTNSDKVVGVGPSKTPIADHLEKLDSVTNDLVTRPNGHIGIGLTPALTVKKKRGRPFKSDKADWDGETPPAPKRYKRTMTIPKLTEPIRNTKLRDLIKAIYRDGALGNDRSLQQDVDAIKELFT